LAVPVPRPSKTCTSICMGRTPGLRNVPRYLPSNVPAVATRAGSMFAGIGRWADADQRHLEIRRVSGGSAGGTVDYYASKDNNDRRHHWDRVALSRQEICCVLVIGFPADDLDRAAAATNGDLTGYHQASHGLAVTGEGAFGARRLGVDLDRLGRATNRRGTPAYNSGTAQDRQNKKPPRPHRFLPPILPRYFQLPSEATTVALATLARARRPGPRGHEPG
jgi:hypothetical protein